MMNRIWLIPTLLFLCSMNVTADDKTSAQQETKQEPTKISIGGVFESTKAVEVRLDTEQVGSAKIKKIVPHGSTVSNGDLLVSFETEDYHKQLKAGERKFATAELTQKESEFDLQQFRKSQQLDRAAAQRTWKAAQQAYKGYLEFDRQYAIESAKFGLAQSRYSLEYVEEDLRQLERMYEEDELTEESEELILMRARRAVESTKFRLKNTEVQSERTLKQTLPRTAADRKAAHERARMSYEKAMLSLDVAAKKKSIETQAANEAFGEEKEKLDELKRDFEKLVINASSNGIVFHGSVARGHVADKESSLKAGSTVTKDQLVMTLVHPKKLQIHATLSEKQRGSLTVGMKGTATPTAFSDRELPAEIVSLGDIPYAKGKYDCIISVKGKLNGLLPSMTCEVSFAPDDDGEKESKESKVKGKKKKPKADKKPEKKKADKKDDN